MVSRLIRNRFTKSASGRCPVEVKECRMLKRKHNPGQSRGIFESRFYVLFVIAFAVVTLFGFNRMPAVAGQDEPNAPGSLLAKAQASGSVRVIVKLNTSFQPEGRLSGPQAAISQQNRIASAQNQLHQAVSQHNVKSIKKFKYIPYTAMELDSTTLAVLMANPLVVSIEEDVPVPPTLTVSVPLIKADLAWTAGYTGAGWTVAILDTGVDKTHSFIGAGKVVAEACFSTTDAGYPSTTVCPNGSDSQTGSGAGVNCGGPLGTAIDGCQHGTHVAGIAAGKSATINGVAKDANIIAIQVFSSFTDPTCVGYGYTSPCALSFTTDQISALEHVYSLRNTYNIASANMSTGGGRYLANCDGDSRKAAIDNLRSAGIATVISSGNEYYTDGLAAPACISTAVSVGATTKTDFEAAYSNYHPTMLSLFAPGSVITSSIPGGGWAAWSGTSMAAPHVTGAWAILKQKSPAASVATLLSKLQTTGAEVTLKAGDLAGGSIKRIDVKAALDAAGVAPNPPTGLAASTTSDSAIALNWTIVASTETGFKIERKTGTGGIYSQIGTTGAGVATYSDSNSGLSEGIAYYYRVVAYSASLNSAYSNEASATTLPRAPSGLSASAVSFSQINLSWTDNSGVETGFKIERKTGANGTYSQIATAAANTSTHSDIGLTAETAYYYRVRAYHTGGDSAYSNEISATTPAIPPSSGGGGGGGCFIATAAFGTPMEKHVSILRAFRDRCLLITSAGQAFVKFYYEVSPPIAGKISQSEGLRFITRCSLMPLVGMAYLMVTYGVWATIISVLILILMIGAAIGTIRRKMIVAHR